MHDSIIHQNAYLFEVVSDKKVVFGRKSQVGIGMSDVSNQKYPNHVFTGLTLIGKGAHIPDYQTILRNTIVEPYSTVSSFTDSPIDQGSYIGK